MIELIKKGMPYNTSRVMNPDYSLNDAAYHEYSPIFLSTTSVLSYGLGFAAVTSIVVHTILHHRQVMWKAFLATIGRSSTDERPDIHFKVIAHIALG